MITGSTLLPAGRSARWFISAPHSRCPPRQPSTSLVGCQTRSMVQTKGAVHIYKFSGRMCTQVRKLVICRSQLDAHALWPELTVLKSDDMTTLYVVQMLPLSHQSCQGTTFVPHFCRSLKSVATNASLLHPSYPRTPPCC
jgi:hypothetical protein